MMKKPVSDAANPPTFAFVTLGCPKNLVDSERMLGKLAQDGYAPVPDADGADVVIVNTCGFIEPARQESLAVIREVPGVDHLVGVFGREEIVGVVDRTLARARGNIREQHSLFRPAPVRALEDTARLRVT